MKSPLLALIAALCAVPCVCFGMRPAPVAPPATPVAPPSLLRIGVAGLSHGHVAEVTGAAERGEVQVVGIFEADPQVRAGNRLAGMYPDVVYDDLGQMLDETRPEAVMAYGSIYDHLSVVAECAPRGIHVMVEKPLGVSPIHARKMAQLARDHGILLLTNYETTWYPANHRARELVTEGRIGDITRMNIFDGHEGPIEIGCGPEFTSWLTDPVLNGGGAVIDFGCYGANLATWLMNGERPLSVRAVLKQLKPDVYPLVDDDATIVVEYPGCTVEIMASWNWPFGRKDMHIYGQKGYIFQDTGTEMRYRFAGEEAQSEKAKPMARPCNNPFAYLTAAVRGEITVDPFDLSGLENNLIVVDILDAAKKSAESGKAVMFPIIMN